MIILILSSANTKHQTQASEGVKLTLVTDFFAELDPDRLADAIKEKEACSSQPPRNATTTTRGEYQWIPRTVFHFERPAGPPIQIIQIMDKGQTYQ